MDIQSLRDKKTTIESNFNDLTGQKKSHTDKITELDTELVKLQGEYRLITDLIDNFKLSNTKESKNAK